MASVAGGAAMMVLQEEFSDKRPSSYLAFVLGVTTYTGLLLAPGAARAAAGFRWQ